MDFHAQGRPTLCGQNPAIDVLKDLPEPADEHSRSGQGRRDRRRRLDPGGDHSRSAGEQSCQFGQLMEPPGSVARSRVPGQLLLGVSEQSVVARFRSRWLSSS